ncbi:BspA family leucine-rich repeat surface protein [Xanthomarina sp. F1114]|uniref:BspA family leucine-rich repeat surface protein n=1 Tax=Xanthomarina sp. F1114 TaxID=2996019 RepID=UPI00225E5525|nr:BspA family leucine-rich repeat surface protein [Xanthomarina sp. F1114]MCX7546895.1 BspA family leucine-rich repeat surface protein [Xanthomarina sp. F1114]
MKNLQTAFKPLILMFAMAFVFTSCSSDDDNSAPTTTYQIDITASPSEGGTTLPQSGDFEKDQLIDLAAIPADGWHFKEWQGDVTGAENPKQITVDAAKNITAVFERDLFYLADNGVTIMAPEAAVGDSGIINGIVYTKRTADQITPENAATTCTSGIEDMRGLFDTEAFFNEDISHWDVSNVTDMSGMFYFAYEFNQDISHWDVSNVTDMSTMFGEASSFNQDISQWNVSNVTDMYSMFFFAGSFNQDISQWDVSNIPSMSSMFEGASSFNQDIGNWNVSNVSNMAYMFSSATNFNQDLSGWCVTNIVTEPTNFASNSALTNNNKPVWGTCP